MIGVPLPLLLLLLLLFWLTDLNKRGRKEQTVDRVQRMGQKRRKFDLTFSLPCFFVAVAPRFQAPFLSGTCTVEAKRVLLLVPVGKKELERGACFTY